MYSYWLKPDPFARYRKSHQVASSVLAPWHLLGEGSESMCVCVSALSQLSVMMHCMLETFLCHVFLLAQVQDRMPPKSVAFNQELPNQFARYRKSLISGNWRIDRAILD